MKPPRPPLRIALRRAAAAHATAAQARRVEQRVALVARLRRMVPRLSLAALLVMCLGHVWLASRALPVASWATPSRLAELADGTAVWVEGTVQPKEGRALADPLANQTVVAYSLDVRRSMKRAVYDASAQRLVTLDGSSASQSERGVECAIGDGTASVVVRGVSPDPATSSVVSWRAGQRVPPALARLPSAFSVVPGERLVAVDVTRARVREGDAVAVYGVVARDERGQAVLAPPSGDACRLVHGGYAAWRQRLLEELAPWGAAALGCAFLLMAVMRVFPRWVANSATEGAGV